VPQKSQVLCLCPVVGGGRAETAWMHGIEWADMAWHGIAWADGAEDGINGAHTYIHTIVPVSNLLLSTGRRRQSLGY
jgi:hypothetical protein